MNNHTPITFQTEMIRDYFNIQPSQVKGRANMGTEYYKRILYNKVYSVFEFGLPDDWYLNWFRFWLFHYGSIGVVYSHKYGWICQPYSIAKINYQYQPKVILVYNTWIQQPVYGEIKVNAGIVHLFDDYYGVDDIVTRYAEMLAQCDKSVNINLMNSNLAVLFEAESNKQANDIKQAYGRATAGEPLVTINKNVMQGKQLTTLFPSPRNNFIALDLMETRRAVMNAFLTEIGIRNVSVQKKERLTAGENSENNDETKALITVMYEHMTECFDYINKLSGLNLSVKFRYDYDTDTDSAVSNDNVSRETSNK